jgi:hypothetical protein
MWFDGTNYWLKMHTFATFRQLIALKGLWKVFENRQKQSLKVFEFFWSWRLRTLTWYFETVIKQTCWNSWKDFALNRSIIVSYCWPVAPSPKHAVNMTGTWYGFEQSANRKIELWHFIIMRVATVARLWPPTFQLWAGLNFDEIFCYIRALIFSQISCSRLIGTR